MALNRIALEKGIVKLQKEMIKKTKPDYEYFARELSKLIEAFVKSGTVTTPAGVEVATTGNASAQKGATTTPGIGTIS